MPKKRYTPEEIIQHFRTIVLETGQELAVCDACRKLSTNEHTYDCWKKEYGGLRVDQATRLKGLEQENLRRKRIGADQARDLSIVKEVIWGNLSARPAGAKPWSTPSQCSRCPSVERVGRLARSGLLSVRAAT